MTKDEKNVNSLAFKKAEEEIEQEKIEEVKAIMKSLLQEIQEQKAQKTRAEESLRILKLEMEDLQAGNLDKIRDRHKSSSVVGRVSPIPQGFIDANDKAFPGGDFTVGSSSSLSCSTTCSGSPITYTSAWWADATGGTYMVQLPSGEIKEYYL